ncbi:MAG: sigma-54 dependent transcriptional regulator [Acidobacteria bacterium]|nr:sigma-54 dependent transcriptional regulator [Acidobacteriota bacterium]
MAELSMSCPNPVVHRGDFVERGQRFSEFLAVLESRIVGGVKIGVLEAAVPAALERLVPIRGARLTAAPAPPLAAREGPATSSLRFPVSVPSRTTDLALEVSIDPGLALGAWERQSLRQAARVVGLLLACRNQAPPPGQPPEPAAPLVGSSAPMRRLREQIERVAATDFTVLIEGECGSGKELVARQVHELSRRRQGPFVAVNCAALVETLLEAELFGIEDRVATGVRARRGKFELADQGTLFLDEVADLSPAAQAKLLRAIQELSVERVGGHGARAVDIRIVVATNQRLRRLADEGRFRTDLYYRLAGVELHAPPLRQRREDIVSLAEHFLARHDGLRRLALSESAADALRTHDWPGNVRELQRVVERALALATEDTIGLQDLPAELTRDYTELLQPSITRAESMRAWGSRYARLMLERCGRNKRRTCEVLGISYHTLQSYLRHPS